MLHKSFNIKNNRNRAFERWYIAPPLLPATDEYVWSGRLTKKNRTGQTKEEAEKGYGEGNPRVALKRLGMNAPGSSFHEGKLMEADEPIPMRLRAHLQLGEERARGMGF